MANTHCTHCGEEAVKYCGGCNVARYCGRECQAEDWGWHKLLCKQSAAFAEKPPAGKEVRRVILLPANGTKPVFYWMSVNAHGHNESDDDDIDSASDLGVPDRDQRGYVMPADDEGCGMGSDMPQFVSLVVGKMGHGELLNHSIRMMVKESFFDYPPSRCLARLLDENIAYNFRGPILFLRMTKIENSSHTLDIDASDFTLALDGLTAYAKKQANPIAYLMAREGGGRLPKKVSGVRVNAEVPYYEEARTLRTSKIFTGDGKVSAISQKIGLALLTIVAPDGGKAAKAVLSGDGPVLPSAYLHVSIDTTSTDFGNIPTSAGSATPSTLVFRVDTSPLTASTVVALCDFIKDFAQPELLKAATGTTEERQTAVDGLAEMWKQRAEDNGVDDYDDSSEDDGGSSEAGEEDEDGAFVDAGEYDDLADVRAKMGQMQMTTVDARTGMGFI